MILIRSFQSTGTFIGNNTVYGFAGNANAGTHNAAAGDLVELLVLLVNYPLKT